MKGGNNMLKTLYVEDTNELEEIIEEMK